MPIYSNNTVSVRRNQFLKSWKQYAPVAMFAEMTLAEFEEKSKRSLLIRDLIEDLKLKLKGLKLERDQADEEMNEDLMLIANGVRGTKAFGVDCPFYRSLGYIPKSERKKGTIRKPRVTAVVQSPPNADAA